MNHDDGWPRTHHNWLCDIFSCDRGLVVADFVALPRRLAVGLIGGLHRLRLRVLDIVLRARDGDRPRAVSGRIRHSAG